MQQFDKLLIFAVSWIIYSASAAFPSVKASEQQPPTSGITLSRSTGNHLFVSVRVNNRPAWLAVDAGAALSIVKSNKAKLLGLAKGPGVIQVPKQIEVNNRIVPVAVVNSLYLGSDNLGSGPVALIDLRDFRARLRDSGQQGTMDG